MTLIAQQLEDLRSKPNTEDPHEHLTGLTWMKKVYNEAGAAAFLSLSRLELDTDGIDIPRVREDGYDGPHQKQTSLDQDGAWLSADEISYFVLPLGFGTKEDGTSYPIRHEGVEIGCLGTVVYQGLKVHAVFADEGADRSIFGEASIKVHRKLGFERVDSGAIIDEGIDDGVYLLIYVGSKISSDRFTDDDIDREAEPLWQSFVGS